MRFTITLLALFAAAFADGGMVVPPDVAIEEFGQVAVIRYQEGIEQLAVVTSFRSEATNLAWILPVPAEPSVDSFSLALLDELQYHCRPLYRDGSGFGCAAEYRPTLGYGDSLGVEEIAEGVIGPYDYLVLKTAVPETLAAYLLGRGFELPDNASSVFGHYTAMNWQYFVVARLRDSAGLGDDRSVGIRLTFAADSIVYPLYISRLSSDYSGVVLYVVAEHRQMFAGSRLLFSGPVDAGTFPDFSGFVDRPSRLTKLLRYYHPANMEDVYLSRAPDDRDFRVIESGYGYMYGAAGSLIPLVGIVIFARRRGRRSHRR